MLKVYIANIEDVKKYSSRAKEILTFDRYEKFSRYKQEDDKLRCLAVGILLNKYIGKDRLKNIKYEENQKPYIEDYEHFNISHSGNFVGLAIDNSIVGLDIEKREDRETQRIAERICTTKEINHINESKDKIETFYKYWTLKESYMKWSGKGFSMSPKSIEFIITDKIRLNNDIDDLSFYVNDFDIDGYTISVCTSDKDYNNHINIIKI